MGFVVFSFGVFFAVFFGELVVTSFDVMFFISVASSVVASVGASKSEQLSVLSLSVMSMMDLVQRELSSLLLESVSLSLVLEMEELEEDMFDIELG